MDDIKIIDSLRFTTDEDIKNITEGEKIYYADLITKINHFWINQERAIILTNKALYDMKKRTLKRKIIYSDIIGITYSTLSYIYCSW